MPEVDRLTPEAIALGLVSCGAFLFLGLSARVFPGFVYAIVAAFVLMGAVGIPLALKKEETATLFVIACCAVVGVVLSCF